jgi:VWFA-related protein
VSRVHRADRADRALARRLISASLIALTVAIAALSGQQQQPQQQPPTFKTEANYVRVDVYPTSGGKPVLDLRQDEFEVLEDGVLQKIDAFEHVVIRPAGPQETRHEPNSVAESRAMLENPRARVFVLFLDIGHVELGSSRVIRKPLVDALDGMIGQDDLIGVMTPEMSATNVTFARRTTTVQGILDRYWWGERDRLNPVDPVEAQYTYCYPGEGSSTSAVAQEMINRRREKHTLDALEDLVVFLRGIREERKAILVITDGWRLFRPNEALFHNTDYGMPNAPPVGLDPRTGKLSTKNSTNAGPSTKSECDRDRMNLAMLDNWEEFRRALDEANRANASFYPVDPRGLVVFDEPIGPAPPPSLTIDAARLKARLDSLRTMAENTDGIAIVDSNNLAAGLKRVVDDLTSYYLLGYYSANAKPDGKFHSIKVRVKRPGVQVRARRGYLAPTAAELTALAGGKASPASAGPPDAAAVEARAIEGAVASLASGARDVPVRLQAAAGWKPGEAAGVWAVGEVPANEDWKGGGDLDFMLTGGSGATLATAHARVEPGRHSVLAPLSPSTPLAPGEYVVRIRGRGANASAIPVNETARIVLPASPDATGAILVRRGPSTGNKDVPTADTRFRRSDLIRVEVPTPAPGSISARLLDRAGAPLTVPVVSGERSDADGSRWHTAQLALAPLAAGDYVIEMRASFAGGKGEAGRDSRTLVAFRVIP